MKITFIYPSFGDRLHTRQMEPLTIATLAGLTPPQFERAFFDDRIEEIDYDQPTDCVAITVQTFTAKRAYGIADRYRAKGIPVVMGGFHPTLVSQEALQHADCVVHGQAEAVWKDFLADLSAKGFRKVYDGGNSPDLSKITPDRSIFSGKKYYPIAMVEFGRGCIWSCSFCAVSAFFGHKKSHRPVANVIADVKSSKRKIISFVDDNLTADKESAKELFKELIPLKIRWFSQVDIRFTEDDELLRLAAESGCFGVLIGFESLNRESVRTFNKDRLNNVEYYGKAVRKLHDYKIKTCASFMLGGDHDDPTIFDSVNEFCLREGVALGLFNAVTPFPGTKMYDDLEREGRLLYRKWWLEPGFRWGDITFKSVNISEKQLFEGCKRLRLNFYNFKSILVRFFKKANLSTPFLYLLINILNGIEVRSRQGFRLGSKK